jgi:hypothetical protein
VHAHVRHPKVRLIRVHTRFVAFNLMCCVTTQVVHLVACFRGANKTKPLSSTLRVLRLLPTIAQPRAIWSPT